MQNRPKILFVTSHWPLAPAYGAQQRVLHIGRLLSHFGELSFLMVPTEQEDEETARRTELEFDVRKVLRPLPVAPDRRLGWRPERIRHEFDPTFLATDPYAVSESGRAEMQEMFDQYDLIWVHTVRTANWFRIYRWPHSVLDVDDLPSRSLLSEAQSGRIPFKRLLDFRRSWIWRRRERFLQDRFDVLTVCSEDDRKYLANANRIYVIPNGASSLPEHSRVLSETPRIGLIGNCTYAPNEEGIKWFVRDIWPKIKREFPNAELRLVGRGSDGHLTSLGPDIAGLGWLQDPGEEIATWSAMIVPIKVGSGTRVKVAEGFARRCPVVATKLGAFGYEVKNGREVLLADSAEDFASACTQLLRNQEFGKALAQRAYERFLERWRWDSFESTVGKVVHECLAMNQRHQEDPAYLASKHDRDDPL